VTNMYATPTGQFTLIWWIRANNSFCLAWRRGVVVIASAIRIEDRGFESCQGVRTFYLQYNAVCKKIYYYEYLHK
jgi:hypothetical protein